MDWLNQFDAFRPVLDRLLLVFALVLARVSGLVTTAPIFGSRDFPLRVRALLAFALAMLMMPLVWNSTVESPRTLINVAVMAGSELVIGVTLGLGVLIIFSGVQVAGQIIGQLSGMSLADVFNPGFDENVPLFSQLLFYVAMAVFVIAGGHRRLLAALLDTFATIPLGASTAPEPIADLLTTLLAQSFVLGVRAAAPVMTAVLLAIVLLGLISRTLPQLNVMVLGFSLNAMMALASMAISLGTAAWVFQEQVDATLEAIGDALHAASMKR